MSKHLSGSILEWCVRSFAEIGKEQIVSGIALFVAEII
jgi:hypothetical protein